MIEQARRRRNRATAASGARGAPCGIGFIVFCWRARACRPLVATFRARDLENRPAGVRKAVMPHLERSMRRMG